MEAEQVSTEQEIINPAIVETIDQAEETPVIEAPATSDDDTQEISDLQAAIEAAETPEDKAAQKAKLNTAFARLRREGREAKKAELEALKDAAYQRGLAEARKQVEAAPVKAPDPIYVAPDFLKPAPREGDFDEYQDFLTAKEDWLVEKAEHRAYHKAKFEIDADQNRRTQEASQNETVQWVQKGKEKFADFDAVIAHHADIIPPVMAAAVKASDNSHEIAYHLGKNQSEFNRIAGLQPVQQAIEIGKLSARLSVKPAPAKTITSAPSPIRAVSPGVTEDFDPNTGSMEDYAKWRESQGF